MEKAKFYVVLSIIDDKIDMFLSSINDKCLFLQL